MDISLDIVVSKLLIYLFCPILIPQLKNVRPQSMLKIKPDSKVICGALLKTKVMCGGIQV